MLMPISVTSSCFNPRTYIRYDPKPDSDKAPPSEFQSTYLYKVRRISNTVLDCENKFQSTYLYKVRPRKDEILNNPSLVSIHVPI